MPGCDTTGKPCALRAVSLLPENVFAWDLFHSTGGEDNVARLIATLRAPEIEELNDFERALLASKLDVVRGEYIRIQNEEFETAKAERAAKTGRRDL